MAARTVGAGLGVAAMNEIRFGGTGKPHPGKPHAYVLITGRDAPERCACGKVRDEAASRRARNNGKRGRAIQRTRIEGLGGKNLAGNNVNLDGVSALFAFESKSGASFSNRYWKWLKGIPLQGQQVGVLIVTDTPGPGRRARSIVVIDYDSWRDLHGE